MLISSYFLFFFLKTPRMRNWHRIWEDLKLESLFKATKNPSEETAKGDTAYSPQNEPGPVLQLPASRAHSTVSSAKRLTKNFKRRMYINHFKKLPSNLTFSI
jgi:hypothetical protein